MPKISWGSLLATGDIKHHLFIDLCNQYGLHQLVNYPTRGSSILDDVLTNGHNIIQDVFVNDSLVNMITSILVSLLLLHKLAM